VSILTAIFLGLIQGLTEFLPVSSSGHLMLFQKLLNMPNNMLLFNIILHVATLCAVVIVFRKKIWQLIRHPLNKTNLYLIIATAITCTIVLIFKDLIDRVFTYKVLPVTFMLTAIVLFIVTFVKPRDKNIKMTTAITAGLAQGIAVIPGLSRSGITIAANLALGTKRTEAAEFSFLMSIPIIIASLVYELISSQEAIKLEVLPTVLAFITALLSGIFAIKFMLHIVARVKLYWFSIYLIILALISVFIL